MNKVSNILFSLVAGITFLCIAAAIFVWDIDKLRQARASRDWPQVEGRVLRCEEQKKSDERFPLVEYEYEVRGKSYRSQQIAFDVFDKPGGQGKVETILARYPVGRNVTVFHDPEDPAVAILEPEVYAPFLIPLMFGSIFGVMGILILWTPFRRPRTEVDRESRLKTSMALAAVITSLVIYLILIIVSFDSMAHEVAVKAFGKQPLGMPTLAFVMLCKHCSTFPCLTSSGMPRSLRHRRCRMDDDSISATSPQWVRVTRNCATRKVCVSRV
jgi:hypothetical protein